MSDLLVPQSIETLLKRAQPEGGFSNTDQSKYRSDATAWAILALSAGGQDQESLSPARARLAASQLSDGRVSISAEHPEDYWPTPLAILAWRQAAAHQERMSLAAHFLLNNSGTHWYSEMGPDRHDTNLQGWPWVDKTHAWVAPTALGIIALKAAGYGNHPRVAEAGRLLLNRECLHGGWNYGNSLVYGAELRPMPEDTGLALAALKDLTDKSTLEKSLDYLKSSVEGLRTPISLAWSLLGLGAWGERPPAAHVWLLECWRRQERFGVYDTTSLSLLILASCASGGLESLGSLDPATARG